MQPPAAWNLIANPLLQWRRRAALNAESEISGVCDRIGRISRNAAHFLKSVSVVTDIPVNETHKGHGLKINCINSDQAAL